MSDATLANAAFRDATRPVDERVDDLLGRMTLDEKLAQLGGVWLTQLVQGDRFDPDAAAAQIPHGIGQVTRIGASTGLRPTAVARLHNEIQRVVVERTRLGIPVLVHEESTGGFCARDATVFPQGLGLASTWSPALVQEVAAVISAQLRAVGARQTLAPVLDVARDPRWGRVEETYGEDPVLAGAIGTAYVRGIQGSADGRSLADGVIATGKHFLGYGLSEGGRNHAPVHLGPRELREVYAEPFAAAIRDAGLASVMNSYSSVDGLPCAGAPAILTDLLRDELGFTGYVSADYFSVSLLMTHHHVAGTPGAAAALALLAGLDVELPALDCFGGPLKEEIDAGRVPMAAVDAAVRRVLAGKVRLGLFEHPYVDADAAVTVFDTPAQRALARRAAAASLVLLTNDGVLPLDVSGASGASGRGTALGTVAVVGPAADDVRLLQGDYHYPAHVEIMFEGATGIGGRADGDGTGAGDAAGVQYLPADGGAFQPGHHYTPHVTPLAGLRAALDGTGVSVVHARGCDVTGDDRGGIEEAVVLAEAADVAVVCVGGKSGLRPHCTVGEARDAQSLDLTGVQEELIAAVAATGTPTVVVVVSGRVHTLGAVCEQVGAVLLAWPPGEEGGRAIADVLLGRANPAGRLPVSLPRHVGQVPAYSSHRAGGSTALFYGAYADGPTTPLFPFGHGLSYTSFTYSRFEVVAGSTRDPVVCSVEIGNTGERDGDEVVQLYVSDLVASVARPERQLVGFARVLVPAGGVRRVRFTVDPSRLAFYDPAMRFVVEPGDLRFAVGGSSADLRAEEVVSLTGEIAEFQQRAVVATTVEIE